MDIIVLSIQRWIDWMNPKSTHEESAIIPTGMGEAWKHTEGTQLAQSHRARKQWGHSSNPGGLAPEHY